LAEAPHWYEQQVKRQFHPKIGKFFLSRQQCGKFIADDFLWKVSCAGVFSRQQSVKPAARFGNSRKPTQSDENRGN